MIKGPVFFSDKKQVAKEVDDRLEEILDREFQNIENELPELLAIDSSVTLTQDEIDLCLKRARNTAKVKLIQQYKEAINEIRQGRPLPSNS